jgi:hypothetical protein
MFGQIVSGQKKSGMREDRLQKWVLDQEKEGAA